MKIGINGRAFNVSSPRGGVQAAMSLVRSLEQNENHEVRIFGYRDSNENRIVSNLLERSQALGLGWEQFRLPKLADESEIDVLYCPNGNAPITSVSTPTVVQMHALNALSGFASLPYEILQRYRVPKMLNNVDGVISVSNFLKSRIHSEVSIDKPHYVAKNGIDPIFFKREYKRPPNLPDEFILFVGGLDRRKNLRRTIEAYKLVRETMESPPKLVIVGAGRKSLDQAPNADLNSPGVVRLGFIDKEELAATYKSATAVVYTSLLEWFGLPPLESMAAQTPVVTSKWQCMPEILKDKVEYVDPSDPTDIKRGIIQVVDNPEYASSLVNQGKELVKQYRMESAVSDTIDKIELIEKELNQP